MLKFLGTLLLIAVLLIVAILIYINVYGAEYTSKYLSKVLKVPVTIEKTELSWRHISIKRLDIKNPDDSPIPSAFKADLIRIAVAPFDFFKNIIHIQEISIDNAVVGIDMQNLLGSENNWEKILNRLFSYDASEEAEGKSKKKVIIDTLIIRHLSIQAKHQFLGPYTIMLPNIPLIETHNLTANTPITIAEALNVLFRAILTPISEKEGFGTLLNNSDELPPSLKDIYSQQEAANPKAKDKGLDKLQKEVEEAIDELGNFFQNLFNSKTQESPDTPPSTP
jgi:hypothetical protein